MKTDHDDGFPKRMATLVDRAGNVTELARKSRLSRRVIDNYKAGLADPSRSRLIALAEAGDVSVEWLATGKGPMRLGDSVPAPAPAGGIDKALMEEVARAVEAAVREEGGRIQGLALVREASRIYDDLTSAYDNQANRLVGLKLAIQQFRREIRSPATPGSTSKLA